jgi:tellurite resistance protein
MTPTVEERIKSVIRALTDVIAPSLPTNAGLATEQIQLCVAHLQILTAQLNAAYGFEQDEFLDAAALAKEIVSIADGGTETSDSKKSLEGIVGSANSSADFRASRIAINAAIAVVISAIAVDGTVAARRRTGEVILKHEGARVAKDRQWFAPYGFDTL